MPDFDDRDIMDRISGTSGAQPSEMPSADAMSTAGEMMHNYMRWRGEDSNQLADAQLTMRAEDLLADVERDPSMLSELSAPISR